MSERPRWLRYLTAVFAALAIAYAARTWESGARKVTLSYRAPAGDLRVSLYDADGQFIRRVEFGTSDRSHEVRMPSGDFRVRMELPDRAPVERRGRVEDTGHVEIVW